MSLFSIFIFNCKVGHCLYLVFCLQNIYTRHDFLYKYMKTGYKIKTMVSFAFELKAENENRKFFLKPNMHDYSCMQVVEWINLIGMVQ